MRMLVLLLVVAVGGSSANAKVFETSTHGTPAVKSIEVIGFGPEGTLLIGDGIGSAVFAVATNEKPGHGAPAKIEGIAAKLAGAVGAKADGLEILDLAVNPVSNTVYFAARKQDDKVPLILTLTSDGKVGLFELASVTYARVPLPRASDAARVRITDVAWADGKLLAGAGMSEEFGSKIFICPTPLKHDAAGEIHSAETYHVAHGRWETKAPMSVIMPYQEAGKTYVVGAFGCTPIVKYPLDALQPDAKVKGISVIELGSGNRPLDMFAYEKDGKKYVLSNTRRFKALFSPSPYWTVRFERGLLDENDNVNEKALRRLQGNQPATDKITMVDTFHGVVQMDKLGEDRAVVLREVDGGRLDFDVLSLP